MTKEMSELDRVAKSIIDTVVNAVEKQNPGVRMMPGLIDGDTLLSGDYYSDVQVSVARDISAYLQKNINSVRIRDHYNRRRD